MGTVVNRAEPQDCTREHLRATGLDGMIGRGHETAGVQTCLSQDRQRIPARHRVLQEKLRIGDFT